jgi:hypothetical protein
MTLLNLKPGHKAVRNYYQNLYKLTQQLSLLYEGAVAPHFAELLRACARQFKWTLAEQYPIQRKDRRPLNIIEADIQEGAQR